MNTFNELLINQDGHSTHILAKKALDDHPEIANHLEQLNIQKDGGHKGMSFGVHSQK
jgi:hypothetical protein